MTGLTRSQIDKLGVRLRTGEISSEDLELLQQVRAANDDALARVTAMLREDLGLEPTSRLKTVNTLVEKLMRERGRLSTVQDIAGVRVVRDMSRPEQDDLVRRIVELFPGAKVVDRRAKPSHGYRAVHVIISLDERLVEVQVRTELQNTWAQLMERLADQWGRQIRYGGPPDDPSAKLGSGAVTRQRVVDVVMEVAEAIELRETLMYDLNELKGLYGLLEQRRISFPEGSPERTQVEMPAEQAKERLTELQARVAFGEEQLKGVLHDLTQVFGADE